MSAGQTAVRFTGAILWLLCGAGLAAYGSWTLWQGYETSTWTRTEGTIVNASVRLRRAVNRDAEARGQAPAPETVVQYTYSCQGKTYTSSNQGMGKTATGTPDHLVTESPQIGQTLPVFYDPTNPSKACLYPGIGGSAWLWMGLTVVAGVLSLAAGLRQLTKD